MMRKIVFFIVILVCPISFVPYLLGQENTSAKKIECTAQRLVYDAEIKPNVQILYGNVEFSHEGAIGYCDTAYFHEKQNLIEAFGKNLNIHINDSVILFGNHLIYNGNTKQAVITKDTVVLTNGNTSLYTDKLIYDRIADVGFYNTHGRLVSGNSTLESVQGWYYTQTSEVYFKDSVVLTTPQYVVHSDTLMYNTQSEIAYFLGPTLIQSEDNFITCEYGWYNTFNNVCQFEKHAKLYNHTQCLQADTIWFDRDNDMGIARRNVLISDSTQNTLFSGHYAEYQQQKGYAYLIDSAVAVLIENNDSLFVHGQEMWLAFDTAQEIQSIQAYYNVRFFREDLQGVCDSLAYDALDSVIYLIGNPVLWSDKNQMKADTVKLYIKNQEISNMQFIMNASIFADVFEQEKFNQIKGINMWLDFQNNKIQQVFIDANAECIYYVQEDNGDLVGIQKSTSSQMRIFFEDNQVSMIRMYKNVKGNMYPENELTLPLLSNFIWLADFRPINKSDIFREDRYQAVKD